MTELNKELAMGTIGDVVATKANECGDVQRKRDTGGAGR